MESVPFRELYLWGAQGTRVVNTDNVAYGLFSMDGTILFDTTGALATNAHLVNAIGTTDTTIEIDINYPAPNGTILQIDYTSATATEERVLVTAGSGTTTLTILRNPRSPQPHAAGALLYVPAGMQFSLLPFYQIPNQIFSFQKITGDIGYVQIVTASGTTDLLPDGEAYHILADTSTANGTYILKIPTQ
jgi:hypothetical protein